MQQITEYHNKVQQYYNFYKEKGIKVSDIELKDFKISSNQSIPCFVALEDIQKQQSVLEIPKQLILNTKSAFFNKELHEIFINNQEFFSVDGRVFEHLILLTFLLREESRGTESEYYQWLQVLGESNNDHLLYWSEEEIDSLQDENIKKEIKFQEQYISQISVKIIQICQKYPDLFDVDKVNRSLVKKLFVHIITRSINFSKYSALVPVADMLNHQNFQALFVVDTDINKEGEQNYKYKQIESDSENEEENEELNKTKKTDDIFMELTNEQKQQKDMFNNMILKFFQGKYEAMSEIKKTIFDINNFCKAVLEQQKQYSIKMAIFVLKLQINLTNKIQQMMDLPDYVQEQYSYMFLNDLREMLIRVKNLVQVKINGDDQSKDDQQEKLTQQMKKLDIIKKKFCSKFKQNQALDIKASEWEDEDYQSLHVLTQKPVKKGEQVYVSYSHQNNRNLLVNYGFCLKNNVFESLQFPVKIDSHYFQFIKPNIHNTLLAPNVLKMKNVVTYKLSHPKLNTDLMEAFRVYHADIFSTDELSKFGKINDLIVELKVIDQVGTMYQEFLNNNNYQPEEKEKTAEEAQKQNEKSFKQLCTEMYKKEQLNLVVQQIKYLQEVVSVILLLKENPDKQEQIITSYIPHPSIETYILELRQFIHDKIKEEKEEQEQKEAEDKLSKPDKI